jgi:integrase
MAEYIVRIISTKSKKRNTGEKFKYHKLALRHNTTKKQFRLSEFSKMSDSSRIETYDVAPKGSPKATQNKLALQRLNDLKRDVERMRDDEGKTWDMWVKGTESKPTVKISKNFYESIPFLLGEQSEKSIKDFQSFIRNYMPEQKGLTHTQVHSSLNYQQWLNKIKQLKGELSVGVLSKRWASLKKCGEKSQDLELIDKVPLSIKPSKTLFKRDKGEIYIATQDELKALDDVDLINHKNLRYTTMSTRLKYEDIRRVFMFSAIYTGIRPQSLEIMKWKQITEEDGKMKIDVDPNKEGVADYWLYASLDAYEYLGKRGDDDDYVFAYYPRVGVGGYKNAFSKSAMLSKNFTQVLKHAGISNEKLTLRQCRHTHAMKTLQASNNDMMVVKERLGHKSLATTQQHYAKFLKDFQEDTLESLTSFSKYQTKKL